MRTLRQKRTHKPLVVTPCLPSLLTLRLFQPEFLHKKDNRYPYVFIDPGQLIVRNINLSDNNHIIDEISAFTLHVHSYLILEVIQLKSQHPYAPN
jgi:hypothetical protein